MELNYKRRGSRHFSCLGGSSQTPLINSDNASDRSTPISANTLAPHSSQQLQIKQNSNTVGHHNNHHSLNNRAPICLTPQMPNSSASIGGSSVFFPPLPPRTSLHKSQMVLESGTTTNTIESLPKDSVDINMNAEHERNREALQNISLNNSTTPLTAMSPNRIPSRLPAVQQSSSSQLSSPTKFSSSAGFFSESHQVLAQTVLRKTDALPQTPVIITPPQPPLPPTAAKSMPRSELFSAQQFDDNYHLYHEPIDSDDQMEQLNGNSNGVHNNSKNDRGNNKFKSDVSEDIYFCYVTSSVSSLKPSDRSNSRSRSYHGPKNSSNSNTLQSSGFQSSSTTNASKNLSAASFADLPLSSSAGLFSSSMIPIHFRDHCIRELLETESNYVHALDMILTSFARPLEPLLRREDYQLIFGHIRYFHQIHSTFQAELVKSAFRSYSKDLAKTSASTRNSPVNHQAIKQPQTPTISSNGAAASQRFFNSSPLSSPIAQDVMLSSAKSCASSSIGDSLKISSCFLDVREKFLKYGEYCATLSATQALLDELSNRNEAIASMLDRCQQDANEGKFKLRDLLSLPMQRILKYHLLLAQLIKNTASSSEDYHGLKQAHDAMVDLGRYINEVKRDTEAIQIINDIEQSIVGLNMPSNTRLTDYGRLVTDGFVRIKLPQESKGGAHEQQPQQHQSKLKLQHDSKVKQKRYVFVFDKVMLLCKTSGVRGYQYKEALVLSEFELDQNPITSQSNDMLPKHAAKDKWSFSFNLVRFRDKTVYSFFAKTQEMKNKWVAAIQKAMDNTRPAACRNRETNHEFLMHTFEKASQCDYCNRLLLGLYYQGYRCRICFASVHKKCLASTRPCGPKLNSSATFHFARASTAGHCGKVSEPTSPSVRSNCSAEIETHHNNIISHLPKSNSSSTQCIEALPKNEYSNLRDRMFESTSASFRESNTRGSGGVGCGNQSRPVSSMINVSLQNSTNHLLQLQQQQQQQNNGGVHVKVGDSTETFYQDQGLGNFILNDRPWFCGRLNREDAQTMLEKMEHGTFLVRVSPKHNGSYVISLNYNSQVKHMRILVSNDNRLFLSQNRYFNSVIELVSWYEENSLVESFNMLDARLSKPYKTAAAAVT